MPATPLPDLVPQSFWAALFLPYTAKRACRVALVVGTLLIGIHQGDVLLRGDLPPVWKMLLTYCVPYSVSSYSTAILMLQLRRSRS